MKNILKMLVAGILALVARLVLRRYRPRVVMVTGSVGKTSTKDAVAAALSERFFVRKSEKSFNTELGVPFTILDVGNPWGNPLAWLKLAKQALALLSLPNHYPNVLVLEVGADRPGDLARMLRMVSPHTVVVTRLPEVPVHVEAYPTPEAVRDEEFSPAYALSPGAPLIIPLDDPYSVDSSVRTSAHIISYGVSEGAAVRITRSDFYTEGKKVVGMKGTLKMGEIEEEVIVKGSVGKTQLLPVAAALAAASTFNIPLPEALKALLKYTPPAGRGRLLTGKNDSTIIDDSYNASPAAVEEALATLKAFPGAKRRIAVLGDMLELGRYSAAEHERLGKLAGDSADLVVAVGIRARSLAAAASAKAMLFDNSESAAAALPALVRTGDVILVKGSQSIRTERIVESLLTTPSDTSLLVRQDPEWKRRS